MLICFNRLSELQAIVFSLQVVPDVSLADQLYIPFHSPSPLPLVLNLAFSTCNWNLQNLKENQWKERVKVVAGHLSVKAI